MEKLPRWAERAKQISEDGKKVTIRETEERVIDSKVYAMLDGSYLVPSDYGFDRYTPDMVCSCGECAMCRFFEKVEERWNIAVPSRMALLQDLKETQPEWYAVIQLHMRMSWQVIFQTMAEELPSVIMPQLIQALKAEGFISIAEIATAQPSEIIEGVKS